MALDESESIAPMQVIVTSGSRIRRERKLRVSRLRSRMTKRIGGIFTCRCWGRKGGRTGAITDCRFLLAGEDDSGKDGEELEDCFEYIHII